MSKLYDDLLVEVNNSDPEKLIDISRVCYTISNICKNLPKEDAEYHYYMIGSLILHHKTITDKVNLVGIPYNCQIMAGSRGLLPIINELPTLLQKIIAQYVINFSIVPKNREG